MPALPPVPQVMRADLEWTFGTTTLLDTRMFLKYSGAAPAASDCISFATSIATAVNTNLKAIYTPSVTLATVKVTDLASTSGNVGINSPAFAGTNAGGALPVAVCLLVNHSISRRYRGGKPRSYFPFGSNGDLGNSRVWAAAKVSTWQGNFNTFYNTVLTLTSGSTTITNIVNVSYYQGFTVVTNPITGRSRNVPKLRTTPLVDNISAHTVSSRIASQRRRENT